ncbi:protein PARALOG OF AIPP2-like isoform X2 [Phragmites australis]|uniref:protein PARALOG OF AIPP2-like isoform X2 n=1 Tax=Phragmites australis TaxID=29695 RepID=UPI002D770049|nr:protein PARALOG OF AIPP2-like isoform X2 [Phragmites australis]
MRAPQERPVRDLYDRTRHKDLAAPEDKNTIRKRLVSSDNTRVKAESGTCNVCYAPCSSCLHRSLALTDSNVDCVSSQTCSTRSEIKNNSLIRSEKGLHNRAENDDEFSAASSNASYSETGGNKAVARSSIAEDSSEVDMPAKRRRLSNQDMRLSRAEYHDDSNSCVTGKPAEGKLLLEKKKLSTSASSRDLTVKDYKDNSIASHSRLRNQCVDESTAKKGSDVHDMHPSSSGRLFPANSSSVMTKKLLRTQSSVSASKGISPKRQAHEFGKAQDNLSRQPSEKASLSNNIIEQPLGDPRVVGGDNHGMLTGCSTSNRNEKNAGFSPKDLENGTSCSKDETQEHADIQFNDDAKRNEGDKQDWDQDCSMDISSDEKLNIQNDVMTDCGNSEGLIDVNVCDICGDVGREYLLATCTRCLEGAEHTYCMRVKLDKVPDGEWLCEECQLKEDQSKIKRKYGVMAVNISEGKNQNSESQSNPKALQVVVPNLNAPEITCSTPTAGHCDAKNQKLHLVSAGTQAGQVKVTTPAAERLDVKNKDLSMANHKKLQVVTSDLEVRPHNNGTPTPVSSNKKNQSSGFWLNRKKVRVSTDMESPLSSEGLRSPPVSCKRLAENTSSPNPKLFKTDSLRKDVFSRENSFKKSNKGSSNLLDNAPVRTTQAVKSSQTLPRSYSLGSVVNSKAPVPSPRGPLSKQLSLNSSNNGPKVKQLVEGVASKLRPLKHSPRDPRDKGPIKKLTKSGSFKCEVSVDSFKCEVSMCKDACSSKQKQSFHLSQDEKPGILKPVKEKKMIERRASFSFRKPNIPSSPRPDSSMKSGERKIDQDISRSGPSILKSSKKTGNVEKKQSSDLSKSEKQDVTVHRKPIGVVSGEDAYTLKISDLPVLSQCVKKDSLNDGVGKDSFVSVKSNEMPTEPPDVLPTTCASMTCESDLQDIVPRANTSEDSGSKVVCCEQKPLESAVNGSCKIVEAAQASEDILPESPHVLQMAHNLYPTDNKLDKPNLKKEAFVDQSLIVDQSLTLENPSRDLVIPEQSYIWQGSFEVSRYGNSPKMFDGIQAYLSTCASSIVREVGKQLPHKIQLAEVPWRSSWPLQFKEVNPTEDNIALFFFAKDAESYESAYRKLLENMLLCDLSLTANIGGTELLIFPSDKLSERTQRWNGLLFLWGIFYARKESSSPELPVTGTDNCPLEPITRPVIQHDVCSPKALQSLGIDLNECPDDDLSDPAVSLGSEMEKSGASTDHNTLLEFKHEDRKLNACEIHHEDTADTSQIVLGHPTAAPYGTHFPTISIGEGHDMMQDYPSAAKGTTETAGRGIMEEEDGFCQDKAPFCVAQTGAIRAISVEIIAKKQALLPSVEVSPQYSSGSKISDDPSELILKSDMGSLDSDLSYKRQNTFHGKHSTCSFGDAQLPSKCMSKIHPLPAGQHNPFEDVHYIYRGPSDPGSLKKLIPDHAIHVLSSDDEDSPEPSTSLNKASLKADESSSSLLSLSLSTVPMKPKLAGSNIGADEPLSLSLGLPSVVEGSRALEMKQFLPEKPGINT